jgi:hypothetical protein
MTEIKQAMPQEIVVAEYGRTVYHVVARAEHTMADAMHGRYLWHRHDRIKPGDRIEIRHAKHEFFLEFYVVDVDAEAQELRYHVLAKHDFTARALPKLELANAKIAHRGNAGKWSVVNGRAVVKDGFETEAEAEAWLAEKRAA